MPWPCQSFASRLSCRPTPARSGGTIYPIIKNIPEIFDSRPGDTSRKMGAYLMWVGMATCAITSTLFLTANAPNLLGLELVSKTLKISVSWREWFLGVLPLGAALFLTVPLLTYWLYPPQIKESAGADVWAAEALAKMGKVSGKEMMMALLAFVALLLWIFADKQINPTMVAIVVFVLMVLTGVITWEDVLSYRQAWNMLIWFGTLGGTGRWAQTGRVFKVVCGINLWLDARLADHVDCGFDGGSVLSGSLHVCQPDRPRHRLVAGLSCGCDDHSGYAAEDGGHAAVLHLGLELPANALRQWPQCYLFW
jgi:di/tricarboxylate transporter